MSVFDPILSVLCVGGKSVQGAINQGKFGYSDAYFDSVLSG